MTLRSTVTFLLLAIAFPALAQPAADKPAPKLEGTISLSSAYLWRGDAVCGFHAAPYVRFSAGGFAIEQYDFLALDGSYKEIDWDLSYKLGDFTFHLADYFFYYSNSPAKENYFTWKKGETTHVDEVAMVYDCSAIPLTVKWFTFFWGDWLPAPDGSLLDLSLSSYFEVSAHHDFNDGGRFSAALGFSVFKGSYTAYTRDLAPIHAELKYGKELSYGKVRFPLGVSLVVNPFSQRCYAAASAGVSF